MADPRRALWAAVLAALSGAAGCSYDFDAPFASTPLPAWDGGRDAATADAADATPDGASDAAADAPSDSSQDGSSLPDGASDALADVDGNAAGDSGCPPGTKWCSTACVPADNPATGCAGPSCAPCQFEHGQALCVTSSCALGACESNYGNCNADQSDGCETSLMSSTGNCGSCGNACWWPHAAGSCHSGTCKFESCETGWSDCDDTEANGCETNTGYDDESCGYCGRVCPSGFHCNNGACRCTTTAQCDTGGGGTCNATYRLCECSPYSYCQGPCTPQGTCGG